MTGTQLSLFCLLFCPHLKKGVDFRSGKQKRNRVVGYRVGGTNSNT